MSQEQDLQQTDEDLFVAPDATPPAEAPVVTRERLEEVNANPDLLTDPAEIAALKPYILDGEEWPEATAVTEMDAEREAREANEAAAAAATPETPAATTGAATPEDDTEDDDTALHRSTLDAVATLRANHKTEMDRLNAIIKTPAPGDKYDPGYDEWREARDNALIEKSDLQESYQDKLSDATLSAQAQTVATREAEKFMGSFDKVAARTPEVKLDRPFKAANLDYANWLKRLETASGITEGTDAERREAAYAKFKSDPAFAATVPPPKDLEKIQMLNEARLLVEAAGGKRSLEGAVLEVLNTRGILAARSTAAATAASQAGAKKVQEALGRAAAAPVTAPVAGGNKSPNVLSAPVDLPSAEKYLTNLLDKRGKGIALTPFETKYENDAKKLIGVDPVR